MENVRAGKPATKIKSFINPVGQELKSGNQVNYLNGIAFVKDFFVVGTQVRANLKVYLNENPTKEKEIDVPANWLRLSK